MMQIGYQVLHLNNNLFKLHNFLYFLSKTLWLNVEVYNWF